MEGPSPTSFFLLVGVVSALFVLYLTRRAKDLLEDVEWVRTLSRDVVDDQEEPLIMAHVPRNVPHIRDAVAEAVVELGRLRRGVNEEANRLVLSRFYRQWAVERNMRVRDIAFYHDRFIASYYIKTEEMLAVERLVSSRAYRNNQRPYHAPGFFSWCYSETVGALWAEAQGRNQPQADGVIDAELLRLQA
jgi:hypothetical protein